MTPVEQAAVRWWMSRRPFGWSEAEHVARWQMNVTTLPELALAKAVAEMLKKRAR